MRLLLAPDKFKSCLSAAQVAEAMAAGVRDVDPLIEVDLCPMADGGEGTVDALVAATGGRVEACRVTGPLPGRQVEAMIGFLGDGKTAVVEMAAASGLHLLEPSQRNPMQTTTFGTGQLIAHAIGRGVRRVILGIGGSATCDGGIGAAQACGAKFLLNDGTTRGPHDRPLVGGDLHAIATIQWPPAFADVEIIVACDVSNPLTGPDGAAHVYGPQKGASPAEVEHLDAGLRHLAMAANRLDLSATPGAGAAGGLGFGMMAFFGATLRSGADIIIDAVHLRERLRGVDLCLTGEGSFDSQSLAGKTPIAVARACRQMNVPCIVLAGRVEADWKRATAEGVTSARAIGEGLPLDESIRHAAPLIRRATASILAGKPTS